VSTSGVSLEREFGDQFSARLDELCARPASVDPARPASDALYLHRVGVEEKAYLERAFDQLSTTLEELTGLLGGIDSGISEGNARGSDVKGLFENLPDVIQTLPAIGRGQLSILSGIASEQRSIGANLSDRIQMQTEQAGERTMDIVRSMETVHERTQEVVRSIDELSGVLRTLPETSETQVQTLDQARQRLVEIETLLATSFTRQEDILMEGFVNQTVAIEGLRDTLDGIATRLESSEETRKQGLAEIIPVSQLRIAKGAFIAAAAAVFMILIGTGALLWNGSFGNDNGETAAIIQELRDGRDHSARQVDEFKQTQEAIVAQYQERITELTRRLGDVTQESERLISKISELSNDIKILEGRNSMLRKENLALRDTSAALKAEAGSE
jgi:chromosome segregation ATPase